MEGSSQAHEVSPLRSKTRSITSAAVYTALASNSLQCAHALSLFITSAQSATSRHRAMHVVYVLESTETSLRELDAVIQPRTTPTLTQLYQFAEKSELDQCHLPKSLHYSGEFF